LTDIRTYGKATVMGRKKKYDVRITLPLSAEMAARLDAALKAKEARVDYVRDAIDEKLARDEAQQRKVGR
jgi:metal-responsive CopG/Arc/MetJ family transcriptional regulator